MTKIPLRFFWGRGRTLDEYLVFLIKTTEDFSHKRIGFTPGDEGNLTPNIYSGIKPSFT